MNKKNKKEENRNMDKKALAQDIVKREWAMFDRVQNIGGRAECQDNWPAFYVMRISQFLAWNEPMLQSYEGDLRMAEKERRNLLSEKYGYMMEKTSPAEYDKIKHQLPICSREKKDITEEIVACQKIWMQELSARYPVLTGRGRPLTDEKDGWVASFVTYLRGELYTYSLKTLGFYRQYLKELCENGKSMNEMILQNQMAYYGFDSLDEAEKTLSETSRIRE